MDRVNDLLTRLVPPTWQHPSRAVIAGSYAIAPQTARDIDLWLLGPGLPPGAREPGQTDPSNLLRRVLTNDPDVADGAILVGAGEDAPAWTEDAREYQDMKEDGVTLLGWVRFQQLDKNIQVLQVTKAKSPGELLQLFDLSVHCHAIRLFPGPGAGWTALPTSTLPSQQPRVLRWNRPQRAYARLLRSLTRYGWPIAGHPDLPRLYDLVGLGTREAQLAAELEHHLSDLRATGTDGIPF
jgi:hypothetical protein